MQFSFHPNRAGSPVTRRSVRAPRENAQHAQAAKEARRRRGAALVLFVVSLIPIMAFMAFAIDVGMMTVAQTQLRDAADAAALAGCRALNGNQATNNNYAGAAPAAQSALTANDVLGSPLQASQLTVTVGQYAYSTSAAQFQGTFPNSLTSGNWDMVQASVTTNVTNSLGFGRIFSFALPNFQATSTAAFRPRDVCVILDFSGSMRFYSLLGTPYYGNRSCNNQDTLVPTFGKYSAGTSSTGMPGGNAAFPYGNANISAASSDGRPPVVLDFYANGSGSLAFSSTPPSSYATTPGGDVPCKSNLGTSASYAQTVGQVLNINNPGNSTYNATFETLGYAGLNMTSGTLGFQGYTQGPGYWGKSFCYWPPDPTNDWRSKYFTFTSGHTDNSVLWDSNGNWQAPSSSGYQINYTAILNFIQSVGPGIFPSQLQSGRILYYSSIPGSINTSTWPPADLNQRFWKDYIDYVLGVMQVSSNQYVVINNGQTGLTGYGADFQWGTVKITPRSSLSGSPKPYMHYGDNPLRPNLGFWFGPMTMVDFLGNYNLWYTGYGNDASRYCWWPGTCHESPTYECKLGIGAAFSDMQNNHPNDMLSLIMFSTPLSGANDTGANRFNRPVVGLSQSYSTLSDSLWYPQATVGNTSATVSPYDASNLTVPRAMGGTCYSMALMLAYNQLSSSSALVNYNTSSLPAVNSYDAGGGGRQGAQKIIIFETDGAPNTSAQANFVNGGSCNSYYKIRYNQANTSNSEYPNNINGYSDNDPSLVSQILSLVNQLAANTSANGYGTTAKPLLLHCIAFGQIIDAAGLSTLNQMQVAGNVNDGANNSLPSWKIINGNASTYPSALQTAIGTILQDGVQVSLIQ